MTRDVNLRHWWRECSQVPVSPFGCLGGILYSSPLPGQVCHAFVIQLSSCDTVCVPRWDAFDILGWLVGVCVSLHTLKYISSWYTVPWVSANICIYAPNNQDQTQPLLYLKSSLCTPPQPITAPQGHPGQTPTCSLFLQFCPLCDHSYKCRLLQFDFLCLHLSFICVAAGINISSLLTAEQYSKVRVS